MIKLSNNWVILSDETQFKLCKTTGRVNKDNEPIYSKTTYHVSLANALHSYINRRLLENVASEEMIIDDIIKMIKKLHEEVSAYE